MNCEGCGEYVVCAGTGRPPHFCSTRCWVAAYRARHSLPKALTELDRWTRRNGKRPVTISGRSASSTSPATWAPFAEVKRSTAGDGFGIMLGDGLGCYDLDRCLDGDTLTDHAAELLASLNPIWVERSMSGSGLHIFVATDAAKGYRRNGVEFYPRSRFIAVTGDRFIQST